MVQKSKAYTGMAYIVMTYIVMAYIVMAYIVLAKGFEWYRSPSVSLARERR